MLLRREQSLQLDIALYHAALGAGPDAAGIRTQLERTIEDGARWDGAEGRKLTPMMGDIDRETRRARWRRFWRR